MENELRNISPRQFELFADILNQSTDSFVFIFDLVADTFYTAKHIANLFDIPGTRFDNAFQVLSDLIYEEDRKIFVSATNHLRAETNNTINIEVRLLNKKDQTVWVSLTGSLVHMGAEGNQTVVGHISIIDEHDRTDPLTNLPTETQLRKDFNAIWSRSQKVSGFFFKVDVDNLGAINEQYGVHTGDFVFSLVSDSVKRCCKGLAQAYRMNSDEIVCMNLSGATSADAQKMYQRLKRDISETEQKIDYDVMFTVSAGIVAFFNDSSMVEDLLKKVNFTLTYAKNRGKNNLTLFNAVEYTRHLRNLDLQGKLRDSIKNGFKGFELNYQPVINARNLYLDKGNSVFNVIGAEALLRWSCPEYGRVSPEEFIPILEESGLIIPVGRWILLTGFSQCHEWNRVQKDFHMSLNLSYIQVKKSDVLTDVQMALERSGVKPENITLELTESGYMDNAAELQELVDKFRAMGLKVDIDDFGTGYSNLRYLQYLKAATLKLDYSFVHKATGGDEGDSKVIKHITQMAHELKMAVCMEGVESEEDIKKLEVYEPDKYQGFYFGRPCTAVQFREHYLRPDSRRATY